METRGFTKIQNQFFESAFWKEERIYSKAEALIDLVQMARWQQEPKQIIANRVVITLNRGQLTASIRFLAERWKWSKKKVQTFYGTAIQLKLIKTETAKETAQTLITICNYDSYEDAASKKETAKETVKRQSRDKVVRSEKEKEILKQRVHGRKETAVSKVPFPQPVNRQQQFENFQYRLDNESNQGQIGTRLTALQFSKLIDHKNGLHLFEVAKQLDQKKPEQRNYNSMYVALKAYLDNYKPKGTAWTAKPKNNGQTGAGAVV